MTEKRVDPEVLVELLLAAFTAADFRQLFYYSGDTQLYSFVNEFSDFDGLSAMIAKVVPVARKNPHIMEKLIEAVKKENPRQFERFESRLYVQDLE